MWKDLGVRKNMDKIYLSLNIVLRDKKIIKRKGIGTIYKLKN